MVIRASHSDVTKFLRAFALFGFLLQFTMPFGAALALSLDSLALSNRASPCLEKLLGATNPYNLGHDDSCHIAGGCCILDDAASLPTMAGELPKSLRERCHVGYTAPTIRAEETLSQKPRGPPIFS